MMDPWVWAILLLVLGMMLLVMEIFFPSAGILAFLSAASFIGALIFGFNQSVGVGLIILSVALVGIPIMVVLAFKYWPKTAMGRRILLDTPSQNDVLPIDPDKDFLKNLVGRTGKARCKMLPSGVISIDGRKIDAVSDGMPIEVGQEVRVIQVRGKRVIVRPVEDDVPSPDAADPLRRPIDEVVEDPFKDPPS